MGFKKDLEAMEKRATIITITSRKSAVGKTISKASSSSQNIADTVKDDLWTAMYEVFPQINEKKTRVFYDCTVVTSSRTSRSYGLPLYM
jgi:hypothetical protein